MDETVGAGLRFGDVVEELFEVEACAGIARGGGGEAGVGAGEGDVVCVCGGGICEAARGGEALDVS